MSRAPKSAADAAGALEAGTVVEGAPPQAANETKRQIVRARFIVIRVVSEFGNRNNKVQAKLGENVTVPEN